MINKKCISPIVGITLLLVVAVVSTMSFQGWINTYSSSLYGDVENQGSGDAVSTYIENVVDNQLYFKNGRTKQLSYSMIKIGDNDCNLSGNFVSGMANITLVNNCTRNLSQNINIVTVVTDKGVYAKSIFFKNLYPASSLSSFLDTSDTDFGAGTSVNTSVYGSGASAYLELSSYSGAIDTGFATSGLLQVNPSSNTEYFYSLHATSTHLYLAGIDQVSGKQWRMEKRYIDNGSLDTSFDSDGYFQTSTMVSNILLSADYDSNYIYLTGVDDTLGGSNGRLRVEKRDIDDGSLVSAFDSDGVLTSNPSSGNDAVRVLKVDSNYLYLGCQDDVPGDRQYRIEKRNKTDASLIAAFGSSGIVQENPTSSNDNDNIVDMELDTNYIYIFGTDNTQGNTQWRIEKRNITSGDLITAFDTDGIVESNPTTGSDSPYGIALDSDYIYIGGKNQSIFRIEKRNITSGALITDFDSDGIIVGPLRGESSSVAYDIYVDSNYVYASGYDNYDGTDAIVVRFDKTTGAIDTSFGTNGFIVSSPASGDRYGDKIFVSSTDVYFAGIGNSPGNYQWFVQRHDLTSYYSGGNFTSQVFDTSSAITTFSTVSYSSTTPTDTVLRIDVGAGNVATPDGTWTWLTDLSSGASLSSLDNNRYVQYITYLNSSNSSVSSYLDSITIIYE